ncbi:MAG: endonuclease VIII [Balneolaceae bacterium]|nr:endonuclease VIII [Balneolaceae bacterium]
MPEGPEIWRSVDKLQEALHDKSVEEMYFAFDNLKEYEHRIEQAQVERVEARGKAILTYFTNSLALYSHNQLYGKWMIRNRGNEPKTNRQLRVAIHNADKSAYLYSASDIEMLRNDRVEQHPYIKKLGPDPLHPQTVFEDIYDRYHGEKFQNRKLTTLLLDQSFISGIGNYLRSEIMFDAGVNPFIKLRKCTDKQKEKLADSTYTLIRRSYETGGITNEPDIVEALKRENVSRRNYRHFAYKRTGKRCYRCGEIIEEKNEGGRKVYYCPSCQLKM